MPVLDQPKVASGCSFQRLELVWGFSCQAVFWLWSVLCLERESRSSFFNRAPGSKRILSLESRFVLLAVDWRPRDPSLVLGQACPGSEQEGPARVAQCPHERRSGARGRCLFAHRGKPGWHSAAVFRTSCVLPGSWFFPRSARYKRAATWRRGGGHRYVPCAMNALSVSQRRTRGCPASSQRDAPPP